MNKLAHLISAFLLLSSVSLGQSVSQSLVPSNEEIKKILVERLGERKDRVGIVVGIIEPAGRRIIAYGNFDKNDARPVSGDTIFEIGSTTKVFTSLLLADMVQHGEVSLSDPVAKYLPSDVKVPERGGRVITLDDLARHRSGLPRLPANLNASANPLNPYAQYSVPQLYEFLSGYTLPRDIGASFEYSNLGVGLLGHVLSLAAGKDYETLIRTRICRPLGMNSTAITLSPELNAKLAAGHDNRYEATQNWDLPTLAGAGALRSTADDMVTFLAAQLGYQKLRTRSGDCRNARQADACRRWHGDRPGLADASQERLGDHLAQWRDRRLPFVCRFDPKSRTGVVVLSNVSTQVGVDDIGFHLLDPASQLLPHNSPLILPPASHTAITLSPEVLDIYVGQYQFAPNVILAIVRKENQIFAQLTGQDPLEIFPRKQNRFSSPVSSMLKYFSRQIARAGRMPWCSASLAGISWLSGSAGKRILSMNGMATGKRK